MRTTPLEFGQRSGSFVRLPPEVYGLRDALRSERQNDLASLPRRGVRGVEHFLHHAPRLAVGDRRLLAPDTAGEVPHLLREAVIPVLFEHRIGPALGRGCFFDRVTEADVR